MKSIEFEIVVDIVVGDSFYALFASPFESDTRNILRCKPKRQWWKKGLRKQDTPWMYESGFRNPKNNKFNRFSKMLGWKKDALI